MKELERMLRSQVKKAMEVTAKKALADMQEETWDYYEGTTPFLYERTGALGDTPRVTSVSSNGNEVKFDAYLDTDFRYTTGKNPTMLDVLNLADLGIHDSSVGYLASTIGKKGFWERAEKKMENTFNETMKSFFP